MNDSAWSDATFQIPGLDCPDELALIEKGLRELPGLGPLVPDYLNRRLSVRFDPGRLAAPQIAIELKRIGFAPLTAGPAVTAIAPPIGLRPANLTLVGGGLLALAGVAWASLPESSPLPGWLAVASALASSVTVARAAVRALRLRAVDMNVLMGVAAVGGIATGDYFEVATAMFLFGIALWLEHASLGRARRAVRSLAELTPAVAHRLRDGLLSQLEDVPAGELHVGDQVLVRPGERVPADGLVTDGESLLNQAALTGESAPVETRPGGSVFAGSLNGEGSLTVRVAQPAEESLLAHVGRLVAQAQAARSPTERFVDRFARRYTPAVIVLAILLAAVPPLLGWLGAAWAASVPAWQWVHRGLVLLVIACPCALVISTPVTIVSGLYRAARRGIFIKGGEHLESAGRIAAIAFDKTGTLTTGEPRLARLDPLSGLSADEALARAAALEQHSEHPLAQSIAAAARERNLLLPPVDQFSTLRGLGVSGRIGGQTHRLGSPRLLADVTVPDVLESGLREATPVLLAEERRLLAVLWLADSVREDAAPVIAELAQLGISPIAIVSGDRNEVTRSVAARLGIAECYGELLPADKVSRVQELSARAGRVAFVGDGVNDAPALAAARLGIAFGTEASATALETADVVIVTRQLARVPELLRLGRRCRRLLMQNIVIALAVKAAVLILAALGLANLWLAVASDVGASLIVIANGMRLLSGSDAAE